MSDSARDRDALPIPSCDVCDADDWAAKYLGVPDRLHGLPGSFSYYGCCSCGVLRLWPIPEDLARYYPADYYAYQGGRAAPKALKTTALRALWRQAFSGRAQVRRAARRALAGRSVADELLQYVREPRARLLDVGCGGGLFLYEAQRLGLTAVGLDASEEAAGAARSRGLMCYVGDLGGMGDIGELSDAALPRGGFDIVRFSHTLEHLPSPRRALEQAARLLASDGQLVALVPVHDSVLAAAFGADWFQLDPPRHLWLFTRGSLRKVVDAAGYRVTTLRSWSQGAHLYQSILYAAHGQGLAYPPAAMPQGDVAEGAQALASYFDALDLGDTVFAVARKR